MKTTIDVTIRVTIDIEKDTFIKENEDCFENAISDEEEDYRDAAIESEAVALFVQEMDYEIKSTVTGIKVKQTEIRSYEQ
jgi:hypothetical protein